MIDRFGSQSCFSNFRQHWNPHVLNFPLPSSSGTSIQSSDFAFPEASCSQRMLKESAQKDGHLVAALTWQS